VRQDCNYPILGKCPLPPPNPNPNSGIGKDWKEDDTEEVRAAGRGSDL